MKAFQNGRKLTESYSVNSREDPWTGEVRLEVSVDGWVAFELLDDTKQVDIELGFGNFDSNEL